MEPVEIFIYDCVIGEDASVVIQQIRAAGAAQIKVRINSPGGDVFAGYAIYNALLLHAPGVIVSVDGLAASIASYIAMAGRKIVMAENAMMMIHNPTTFIAGDADELRRNADLLDKCAASITDAYERRTKLPRERITTMMDDETWLTPDMAKTLGFIDEVTPALQMAAHFDMSKFRNAPRNLNMNPFKSIIALLIAALPGQLTLTDSSQVADVETGVKKLTEDRDSFRTKALNLAKSFAAKISAALPGKVTLTETSDLTEIENGLGALAADRDGFKTQVVNLTKSVVALISAALPGKVTLTETSTQAEIEAGFRLLVGERDGLTSQVTNLTTERDRAKKHVVLLETWARANGLDISGIDPDKVAAPPVPPVANLTVEDFQTRLATTTDPVEQMKILNEFTAAAKAGKIKKA